MESLQCTLIRYYDTCNIHIHIMSTLRYHSHCQSFLTHTLLPRVSPLYSLRPRGFRCWALSLPDRGVEALARCSASRRLCSSAFSNFSNLEAVLDMVVETASDCCFNFCNIASSFPLNSSPICFLFCATSRAKYGSSAPCRRLIRSAHLILRRTESPSGSA